MFKKILLTTVFALFLSGCGSGSDNDVNKDADPKVKAEYAKQEPAQKQKKSSQKHQTTNLDLPTPSNLATEQNKQVHQSTESSTELSHYEKTQSPKEDLTSQRQTTLFEQQQLNQASAQDESKLLQLASNHSTEPSQPVETKQSNTQQLEQINTNIQKLEQSISDIQQVPKPFARIHHYGENKKNAEVAAEQYKNKGHNQSSDQTNQQQMNDIDHDDDFFDTPVPVSINGGSIMDDSYTDEPTTMSATTAPTKQTSNKKMKLKPMRPAQPQTSNERLQTLLDKYDQSQQNRQGNGQYSDDNDDEDY